MHQVISPRKKPGSSFARGCLIIACVSISLFGLFYIWLLSGPEGGVRLQNEMEEYAIEYIAANQLLRDGEKLFAYYDVTVSLDGTEAAFVTNQRVFYLKNGYVSTIEASDIVDVVRRTEAISGDIIEIKGTEGGRLKIEIAPFNQGEIFYNTLMDIWENKSGGS